MALASKLLALLAVLLMPFAMAAAPAQVHHAATQSTMEHCPDEEPKDDSAGVLADCTMACSSALPANEWSPVDSLSFADSPAEPALARSLAGLILEIATPPPKRS